MKVAHVIGARPQFIKAAMLSRAFQREGIDEVLIHTGQHYDDSMSAVFFEELGLPKPAYHFIVESESPAAQTGEMVASLEQCLRGVTPDLVLVHGDTNSTLAGALAAERLTLPLAHNEAGLRSFNRTMPEEHNRVITDHSSVLLFCPTERAKQQLLNEGLGDRSIHVPGDVMFDAAQHYGANAATGMTLAEEPFALLTVHRAYTVDSEPRLKLLLEMLNALPLPVVFPAHPRTLRAIEAYSLQMPKTVRMIPPVGYFDMLALEQKADWILTDSGGVQKEAYFFGTPCITLRPETEWIETVETGWNTVTDLDSELVLHTIDNFDDAQPRPELFGDGHAAEKIAHIIAHSEFRIES